jgi:hypothetical protein
MAAKGEATVFAALNVAILSYLLVALCVDASGLSRGFFTDYVCGLTPTWLVPINVLLLVFGLVRVKRLRFWVLVPATSLILSLCFRDSFLFWVLRRYVPGK